MKTSIFVCQKANFNALNVVGRWKIYSFTYNFLIFMILISKDSTIRQFFMNLFHQRNLVFNWIFFVYVKNVLVCLFYEKFVMFCMGTYGICFCMTKKFFFSRTTHAPSLETDDYIVAYGLRVTFCSFSQFHSKFIHERTSTINGWWFK